MSAYLLDSNVLVYWLHEGARQHGETAAFIHAAARHGADLYVLSSSLNDVYYVLHAHYMREPEARASIRLAAETFDVVDLTYGLVTMSLGSDEPDYEDGLIRAAAESLQVDAIVSYDVKAFHNSVIPRWTADEALAKLTAADLR